MTIEKFWTSLEPGYQKHIQVTEQSDETRVAFPLVITPTAPDSEGSKDALLREITGLAAQPNDLSAISPLRRLLDAHGGAIHFRNLPLGSPQDFSDFLTALAGSGPYGWKPHIHKGSEVLRKPLAEHVMTANEGPPTHYIGWHNEYAVSPTHPAYVVLFCQAAPTTGGETSIVNSLALHDRMQRAEPEFIKSSIEKGIAYKVPHTAVQQDGTLGGAGVYKACAFGPPENSEGVDDSISIQDTEENRRQVESRIRALASMGGWRDDLKDHLDLPEWQRRGFDWTWKEGGGLEVVHRMPGVRVHPTQQRPAVFNSLSTRHHNATKHQTFEPPFTYRDAEGKEILVWPPHFAGVDNDEPIPRGWLDQMDKFQKQLSSDVQWHPGDVLLIDNFAVQHARWAWSGERKVFASFWDQPGLRAEPIDPRG
ncbi:Clavaminate synthase-like protein [Penicillium freii]|uniref:TauD/TfdA-like domain-containing protein n=1 Tax=Penicillium freii TaxID=48697 RepID=A0A117NPJ1_PENFR|nr:Clavaminate synthase-like protein [Penicillium freii]KUM62540.1 hypothetical protein ACN42_g4588 [Penicillium freii]